MSRRDSAAGTKLQANADADWNAFDPEAYFAHYYADPHPDDLRLTALAARAIAKAEPITRRLDLLDVGTGASLIPLLCGLPRAQSLTAWEYGTANAAWLRHELGTPALRPAWKAIWADARAAHAATHPAPAPSDLPDNPLVHLAACTRIVEASLFDLPACNWDAVTMFFCAESITTDEGEFCRALDRVCGAVRPGGTFVAAFLVQSDGYTVAGRRFPALRMSAEDIQTRVRTRLSDPVFENIGIVSDEIRSGYTGAVFACGRIPPRA